MSWIPPPIRRGDSNAIDPALLVARLNGLKRQIPLLYATICANLFGFHLASGQQSWSPVFAAPALCIIVYRLFYWLRLRADALSPDQLSRHLDGNLKFTRVICLLFLGWSGWILVNGTADEQQYVVLFTSLAAIGCAVALACVPAAATQPLLLLALPIAAWSIASGDAPQVVVGVSLGIVVMLIRRMLVVQNEGVLALLESKSALEAERERSRASEERYAYVSCATNDLIWDWDLTTNSLIWNDAVRTQLGYSREEVGRSIEWWEAQLHPDDAGRVSKHLRGVMESGGEKFEDEYRFRRSDGSYAYMFDRGYIIRDATGAAVRMVGVMQDLTERKAFEEKLLVAATRDPLTCLPNRSAFRQRLAAIVQSALHDNRHSSVLLLDLDDFKQVNDMMGHDAGDALLNELAGRLTASLPEQYEVARLGGDEFAILAPGLGSESEVEACAAIILRKLHEPFVHQGRVLDCGATIGAAIIPKDGRTPEEIMKSADIALYSAKANRRGGYTVHQPIHRLEIQQRLSMRSLAKAAVRDDRLVPLYQPKVKLADGRVVGFEALLRWRHGSRGLQLPDTIAAAFEDFELAKAMSDSMVEQVLVDVRAWLDRGVPFGHIAINAAAAEFRRPDFAEGLLDRLEKAQVSTRFIQLEVTENVFLGRGADGVGRSLHMLSSAGVSIALDDFGTGYASLRHLKDFPVDEIKIDQSFVRDMEVDAGDETIVRGIINLAKGLGLKAVAEGVETQAQADKLTKLGCEYGQGFLFAKAMPAIRVPAMVTRRNTEVSSKDAPRSGIRLKVARG